MDFTPILEWLVTLKPWVIYILMGLGMLVVLGVTIDNLIPDEKDKGFMKFVLTIPIFGDLLKALAKFSPLNNREDKPQI